MEQEKTRESDEAYRIRQANSVKIAKIVAFTVILSSFILGSFMLASTYLQAKATCDQVSALDAILDKELMLETMQQDLPNPEALMSREVNENTNVMQDLSKDEMHKPNKKDETNPDDVETIDVDNNEDEDELNDIDSDMKRVHIKLPLDFDLSELAHNILMNNQKSRMNCVVERRRTEELEEPKPMNPFNVFMNEPKKEKVTGERIAIFCETGAPKEPEPIVQIRRIVMPFPFAGPMNRFAPQMGPQMGPQFHPPMNQPPFPPQFPPQVPQFMAQNQVNMPSHMNMPPQRMNFQGPTPPQQMDFQGPPPQRMNFQGPPPPQQMNFQGPPPPQQMNFQGPPPNFQPQMRIPFPPQNIQFTQQQLPSVPAQMMTPPRPEVPQFRLINPAPQQLPNLERQQSSEEESEQPMPIPEVRIHLRRIHMPASIGDIFPFLNSIQNGDIEGPKEIEAPRQNVQVQQMPLAVALSKVGITPEDLRNIQEMAERKFQEHIREMVEDNDSESESTSEEDSDSGMQTATPEQDSSEMKEKVEELSEASSQQEQSDEEKPQILALGRSNFGRSLNPVQLPSHMTDNSEIQEAERADFVHPR
ncbi:CLUMA_CG021271, isoform A [Clunio marinus]|uniref:CLUMA_CG021271, isoform A n=1 Tax=Clunio marinus TaxID=568069 RepID=A0A1J1JBE9_9DIPT|nr:CLUMA_CG021271, isoform A [Clunio marinus]